MSVSNALCSFSENAFNIFIDKSPCLSHIFCVGYKYFEFRRVECSHLEKFPKAPSVNLPD